METETRTRKRFTEMLPPINITSKQKQSIYALADIRGQTMSDLVRDLINESLGNISTEEAEELDRKLKDNHY